MEKLQNQLEKLRREAAECLLLSNLATDPEKRQLFANIAEHIAGLASGVESALAAEPANVVRAADLKRAEATAADQKQTTKSRRMLRWFVVLVLVAATVAFVWRHPEKGSPFTALEAKAEPPPAQQEDTTQVIANFLSAEEQKWKSLAEQLGALSGRMDNLERARAEMVEPATERASETGLEPTTKRDVETLRQPRHRKTVHSSSRRLQSGLFGNAPQLRF